MTLISAKENAVDAVEEYPLSKIAACDTKIELNCRPVRPILLYLEERYGRKKLTKIIQETKMRLDYLEDTHNWVSYDYFCRLLAKLVECTGNPNAPFEAGTYSSKKECYGALEKVFISLGNPRSTYGLIAKYSDRYSKLGEMEVSNSRSNRCTITARYHSQYKQVKNNCLNLQGIFASVPTEWNLPLAEVKEIQCAAEGSDSCVYEVSWRNKPSHLFGLLGLFTGLVVCVLAGFFPGASRSVFALIAIPLLGYLFGRLKDYSGSLKDSVEINEQESKDLIESIESIEAFNVELQDNVEERTCELHASNEKLQKTLEELKKSQHQLIQSEKMASVGLLAAGMAHELNNPVGAVRNYLQDVLEDTTQEDSRRERLRRAEIATGRCKRIVTDLLTFAREDKQLQLVDINDAVEAVVSNAAKEIANPHVTISKELRPGLAIIRVDLLQIQQVLMNMIMNACDATRGEGEITVKTGAQGKNIYIEIADNGNGIPEDVQDKIFDPFFTTKSPGNGTGLGLAISYNIIKRFNGDIRVESSKGRGTTFTITLPLGDEIRATSNDTGSAE